jgi:hypothetical protein
MHPYGFTHLYTSRSEDLTVTSSTHLNSGTQLWLSEPITNDSIAVVSNPQPYDYQSDALTTTVS